MYSSTTVWIIRVTTNRVYTSRHVLFNESSFPFYHISTSSPLSLTLHTSSESTIPSILTFTFPPSPAPVHTTSTTPNLSFSFQPTISPDTLTNTTSSSFVAISEPITTNLIQPINTHSMQTRSKSGIFKPKALTTTKHPYPLISQWTIYLQLTFKLRSSLIGAKQCKKKSMPLSTLAHGLLSLSLHHKIL